MFALGAAYSGGYGLAEDRTRAQRWFQAAAELGHGQAQLILGRYLALGAAGERDAKKARHWLERSAAQGVSEAAQDLSKLSELNSDF